MKKVIICACVIAALGMTSCSTITHTSSTETVDTELLNRSTADLEVSAKKTTYKYIPTGAEHRAGTNAMKLAAVAKALEENGNADVLVAPQYEMKKTRGLFSTKVKYITVKGYPAKYKNIHSTTPAEAQVVNTLNGGTTVVCK